MAPANKIPKCSRKCAEPPQAPPRRYPRRSAVAAVAAADPPSSGKHATKGKRASSSSAPTATADEQAATARPTVQEFPSTPTPAARMVKLVPPQGLGCEPAVGSLTTPSRKREYKATSKHAVAEGKQSPVYAVVFNFLDVRYYDVFAVACGPRVLIYRCLTNGNFDLLQGYLDDDRDETFYTVSWACDIDGAPLLVAGGSTGAIRIINCATEKIHKTLVGHGASVNEIKAQALKPSLVISASKDESIRLWNAHTGIFILNFAGNGGHRHEVLSVDFHISDIYRFASSGMDNTVRIWSMKAFWPYVEQSYSWADDPSKFPTKYVQFPVLVAAVHSNYVDCTRWLGDFILSKSVENEILLWEPIMKEGRPSESRVDVLQKYPVPECNIWFIKFSCDFHFNQLAIGNREGKVFVWEVQESPPVLTARLTNPQLKSPIRQTAVSFDGSTILGCSDDGNIWRWDEVDHPSVPKVGKKGKQLMIQG